MPRIKWGLICIVNIPFFIISEQFRKLINKIIDIILWDPICVTTYLKSKNINLVKFCRIYFIDAVNNKTEKHTSGNTFERPKHTLVHWLNKVRYNAVDQVTPMFERTAFMRSCASLLTKRGICRFWKTILLQFSLNQLDHNGAVIHELWGPLCEHCNFLWYILQRHRGLSYLPITSGGSFH